MKGYADVNSFVAQMIPFVFVIKEIYHNNAWLVFLENILIIILDFFLLCVSINFWSPFRNCYRP